MHGYNFLVSKMNTELITITFIIFLLVSGYWSVVIVKRFIFPETTRERLKETSEQILLIILANNITTIIKLKYVGMCYCY